MIITSDNIDEAKARIGEQIIAEERKVTGRSCGNCSMCCKVLQIDHEPEIVKSAGQWCQHCRPGKGCSIYDSRPNVCRGFACQWLVNPNLGDEWKPTRSKIVVHLTKTSAHVDCLRFVVDPVVSDRWRDEPYYERIKAAALRGLRGYDGFYLTFVDAGERHLIILPNKEVEIPGTTPYTVGQIGEDRWDVFLFADKEKCDRFVNAMNKFIERANNMGEEERLQIFLAVKSYAKLSLKGDQDHG